MIRQTYTLELITPCFCGGADPSRAEIRSASVRGAIRWWFRAVGNSSAEEADVFGSAACNKGKASSVKLNATIDKIGPEWRPPRFSPNDPDSYVWHYARESGKPAGSGRGVVGPRWNPAGAIPPGSVFHIDVVSRQKPSAGFELALNCFLLLGSLGLRGTRGLGAFHCENLPLDLKGLLPQLEQKGFTVRQRGKEHVFDDYVKVIEDYASWLRYDLRKEYKANRASPLGGIDPRQTSALRFRPLRTGRKLTWLAYEAPHERVLGPEARLPSPILEEKVFNGAAPRPPQRHRR